MASPDAVPKDRRRDSTGGSVRQAQAGEGQGLRFRAPGVYRPRAGLAVNGTRIDRLLVSVNVVNNNYFSADTFRCSLAYTERDTELGSAFWDGLDWADVEVFVGLDNTEAPGTSIIAGRVDDVEFDLERREVRLTGRDYTANLMELTVSEKYPNQTASEIAETIAGLAGLTAVVTPTTTKAGTFYEMETAQLAEETTGWNLLTFLADREGMVVYVRGKELHFEPRPDPAQARKWTITYTPPSDDNPVPQAEAVRIHLTRSLTAARDITVNVLSWAPKTKRHVTGVARTIRPSRGPGGRFGGALKYTYHRPAMTQEQADREAQRILAQISRQQRVVELHLPGDPDIDTSALVTLRGTGTSFDQDYFVDEVDRNVTQNGGFSMRLRCRNIAPEQSAHL